MVKCKFSLKLISHAVLFSIIRVNQNHLLSPHLFSSTSSPSQQTQASHPQYPATSTCYGTSRCRTCYSFDFLSHRLTNREKWTTKTACYCTSHCFCQFESQIEQRMCMWAWMCLKKSGPTKHASCSHIFLFYFFCIAFDWLNADGS